MINHHLLIVVLAAGSSNRYGRKNKLLETFNEKLVLETTLENVLKVFNTDKIIVITGYQNNKIEQIIEKYNVKSFFNKNYTLGIVSALSNYQGTINRTLLPYSQFQFNSNFNWVTGAHYNWINRNFNFMCNKRK